MPMKYYCFILTTLFGALAVEEVENFKYLNQTDYKDHLCASFVWERSPALTHPCLVLSPAISSPSLCTWRQQALMLFL